MKDRISQPEMFILNIYGNEHCRESLQALYAMSLPDLVKLHSFVSFRASVKTLQQHHQFQQMEAAQAR